MDFPLPPSLPRFLTFLPPSHPFPLLPPLLLLPLSTVFIKPVSNFTVEPVGAGGGFMSVCISWLPSQGNVEYIVTVTDPLVTVVPNCTSPGRNPPCFLARNTVSGHHLRCSSNHWSFLLAYSSNTWIFKILFFSLHACSHG